MQVSAPGNSMRSSMMGRFSSQSVSPVMTSLRPATAMISPVLATFDVLTVVGVHHEQAPDALLPAFVRAQSIRSSLQNATGHQQKASQLT